jgi:hypothetical protein
MALKEKEQDVDSRIETLLDQLQDSTSQVEIELIEKKIAVIKSMK